MLKKYEVLKNSKLEIETIKAETICNTCGKNL
ncbi:MAG: hydrogenase maturation nickel metallochaperone HypA [Clostridium sp.]|nr:MAG: hydrogenase maturation nickel metallochaperone HypA [Clostridium sp.]